MLLMHINISFNLSLNQDSVVFDMLLQDEGEALLLEILRLDELLILICSLLCT